MIEFSSISIWFQLIKQCQDALVPEKANILLYSKNYAKADTCDQEEPWFHTKYSVENIPEDWMQVWKSQYIVIVPLLYVIVPKVKLIILRAG